MQTMLHITALLICFLTAHAANDLLSGLPYGGIPQWCGDEDLNKLFADTPESCRRIAFYPDPDEPDFFPTACSSECGEILYQYYRNCVDSDLAESFNVLCAQNEDSIPCYNNIDDSYNTTIEIGSYCAESAMERYFVPDNGTGFGFYDFRPAFPGRCQNCSSLMESFKTSVGCCADTLMLSILSRPYGFTTQCQEHIQPNVPTFCTLPFGSVPSTTERDATEDDATEDDATEDDDQENNSDQTNLKATMSIGLLAVVAMLPLYIQ